MSRTRYFHEDDYRQHEFLPSAAWAHCASEVQTIDEFATAHEAGHGWTDVYVRDDGPHKLIELALPASPLVTAIEFVLRPFDQVTTGYSTHVEVATNVRAFGDDRLTLFLESDARGCLTALWLDSGSFRPDDVGAPAACLSSIPSAEHLLFVDWAWSRMFRAADIEAWKRYLAERALPLDA